MSQGSSVPAIKGKSGKPSPQQIAQARAVLAKFVRVVEEDGRFPAEAFQFLEEGLEHTVRSVHADKVNDDNARQTCHVSGQQLCRGLCDLAVARWGKLAKTVLNNWGIHSPSDFGEMVFLLVRHDLLQKTDHDRQEDFNSAVSFLQVEKRYAIESGPLHVSDFEYRPGSPAAGQMQT